MSTDHTALIAELLSIRSYSNTDDIVTIERAASALSSVQAERDDWQAAHSSAVRDGRLRLAKAKADLDRERERFVQWNEHQAKTEVALHDAEADRDRYRYRLHDTQSELAEAEVEVAALRAVMADMGAKLTALSSVPAGGTTDPYASVTRAAYTDTEPGQAGDTQELRHRFATQEQTRQGAVNEIGDLL